MPLDITLSGFDSLSLTEALVLRYDDLQAVNTEGDPEKVAPTPLDCISVTSDRVEAVLPAASWSMIRLRPVFPS
jgi:alpha-N-arabinofuranosidase